MQPQRAWRALVSREVQGLSAIERVPYIPALKDGVLRRISDNASLADGLLTNAIMFCSYFNVETGRAPGRDIAI
jgi:hypothetical protein